YARASALVDELVALADEKGASYWKALGSWAQGFLFARTGKVLEAVPMLTSGIAAFRATGATVLPAQLSNLAMAHAEVGQFDDAWRCISEAITMVKTTKTRLDEVWIHCTAEKIALQSPARDAAKAEAYFEHALAVARAQQA